MNDIKVIFPVEEYKKWRAYIASVRTEISGLGKVLQLSPNLFVIEEIQIFEQIVTGGSTIITQDALAKFYDEKMQQGKKISEYKLWWHSHAYLGSFFSDTDENTITDFDNETDKNNWLMSIVSNKAEETKIRLDIFKPIRITIEDIPFEISYLDEKLLEDTAKEVREKLISPAQVRQKKETTTITKTKSTVSTIPLALMNPVPTEIILPNGKRISVN